MLQESEWPYQLPTGVSSMQDVANKALLATGNPYLFHAEGGPYLGLPLYKQKVLAKIRRGGTRTRKSVLKQMKKASKQDYTNILLRCIESYIWAWEDNTQRLDRITIILKLPFNFRKLYRNDFPRVTMLAYNDWHVFVSVKVDSIVDYLFKHGNSAFDSKTLRKSLWAILQEQQKMYFLYEVAAPISIVEGYADIIKGSTEGSITPTPRKDKGRIKTSKYRARRKK